MTIPLGTAHRWMPTLAAVDPDFALVLGERATAWPERSLIRSVKSRLRHGDASVLVTTRDGVEHRVDVDDVVFALLGEAASRIERSSAMRVGDGLRVRFGCPAAWTAGPRRRLASLAGKAGFDLGVADILDEPIAAGVSWVMGRFVRGLAVPQGRVVVFDQGGGTLDVAVLDVRDASPPEITVLSAAGLDEAGDKLDETIAADVAVDLGSAGFDVASHPRAPELGRLLRAAAENLKVQLTARPTATTDIGGDFRHLPTLRYDRTRLEAEFGPQMDRALRLVFASLRAADIRHRESDDPMAVKRRSEAALAASVSYVLLVGGMSRVPAVATRLTGEFPEATVETDPGVASPEESVVNGLTYDDVVSDLNLHRPGFDFVVRFRSRDGVELDRQVVYPAYAPLYSPSQVAAGDFLLGRREEIAIPAGTTHAELSCVDAEGSELELHVDGTRQKGVRISTGRNHPLVFKLYVDGRVLVRSAEKRVLRVERWPVLRSGISRPAIGLRTEDDRYGEQRDAGWWTGGE